jgi:hypothetical protein
MRQSLVMRMFAFISLFVLLFPVSATAKDAERRLLQVEDIHRIKAVGEIAI